MNFIKGEAKKNEIESYNDYMTVLLFSPYSIQNLKNLRKDFFREEGEEEEYT